MSRAFSLPTVFRMVSNDLLAEFFARLNNPCFGMDWKRRPQRHVESVLRCLDFFPPHQREAAELILRHVFDLACDSGLRALQEAARRLQSASILQQLPASCNPYHQALWAWLHAPDVFDEAVLFHDVEQLAWWRKRGGLPRVAPRTDAGTLAGLASDLARLLTREQSRGHRCTIEHVARDADTDYFFCFPDDYVRTVLVHDHDGQLVTKTLRQTFDIIFAYRQPEGTLELYAEVPARLKRDLEELFATRLLGEAPGSGPQVPVYQLNRLKECQFRLPTDPADQVAVQLRKLRLDLPDQARITLEAAGGRDADVSQLVAECLNEERVTLEEVDISLATFRFQFQRTTGRERQTMTFDVAAPHTCNLRAHRPERAAVARKHLRMWRIAHD